MKERMEWKRDDCSWSDTGRLGENEGRGGNTQKRDVGKKKMNAVHDARYRPTYAS